MTYPWVILTISLHKRTHRFTNKKPTIMKKEKVSSPNAEMEQVSTTTPIEQPTTERPEVTKEKTEAPKKPENQEVPEKPEIPEKPENQEASEKVNAPESQEAPENEKASEKPIQPPTQTPALPEERWRSALKTLKEDPEVEALAGRIAEELLSGKLCEETIEMIRKSAHYDHDVAEAARQGEIRGEIKGRNTRIDEYLIERRKAAELHDLGGTSQHASHAVPHHVIGGLSAADRLSIWERGNEKRVKRG